MKIAFQTLSQRRVGWGTLSFSTFGSVKLGLVAGSHVISFSPLYFRRIYGLLYEKYTPSHAEELRAEITRRGWIGFNVTTPYKEQVFSFLDEVAPEVAAIHAVNTITIAPDGRWTGYNTDFQAARYLLSEMSTHYPRWEQLLVLGTGGAARAAAYAHVQLFPEVPVTFISRQPGKNLPFPAPHQLVSYEDSRAIPLAGSVLVIQATPLGMFPEVLHMPPFPLELIQPGWIVWDLIYNPNPTTFLMRARERGAQIEGGINFFRKQADYALQLWSAHWERYYKRRRP